MKTPLDKELNKAYEAFNRDHDHLRKKLMASLPGRSPAKTMRIRKFIGDTIMKSRITKLAAAAVIIIAVLIGINQFGGSIDGASVAWADVVQPILTARTVVFNVITVEGENVPVTRVMNMGTQRVRNEVLLPDGVQVIAIVDFGTSRMLTLNPKDKTAALIDLKDMPEKPENVLETMRNIIMELQEDPALSVEPLGKQELDGQIATVFRATGPDVELTVWADPETTLPIRMEQKWRQMQVVYTNFEFDVVLDESLFSMEIPEGYSEPQKAALSITGLTEQDLIETLRIWAVLDGVFPKDFSTQAYMDDVPKIREKASQHSDEQNLENGMKMIRGWVFFRFLKAENDWHYVGKDVKLGDGDSPICWYKPTGLETYRVIFGDLTVEDAAPEDLPE